MDRTGIIVVSLCIVLLAVWFIEQSRYAGQMARSQATNSVVTAQAPAANSNAAPTVQAAPASPTTATAPSNTAAVFGLDANTPEQTIVVSNALAHYTFTPRGGGLKSVDLLDYPETISPRWKEKGS